MQVASNARGALFARHVDFRSCQTLHIRMYPCHDRPARRRQHGRQLPEQVLRLLHVIDDESDMMRSNLWG